MNTGTEYTRVYLKRGRVAHLIFNAQGVNSYENALCGMGPRLSNFWYGTGTQDETELAADLPTCMVCHERARPSRTTVERLQRNALLKKRIT